AVEKLADQRDGAIREVDGVEAGDAANRQQGKSITGRRAVVGRRVDARRNVEAVHRREIDTGGPDRVLDARIGTTRTRTTLDIEEVVKGIQSIQGGDTAEAGLIVGVGRAGDFIAGHRI